MSMNNQDFLHCIKTSFLKFLQTNSRSNEKLKVLHGAIASDLATRLGKDYRVQSLGFANEKEGKIAGRYMDKKVDIVVSNAQEQAVAGMGVKFVMQNYAQNANNYFESMLGETANIQSNHLPYFQLFIIPYQLPYYSNTGAFMKWENLSSHHLAKYRMLSQDNSTTWAHTPTKTLLYLLDLPKIATPQDKQAYAQAYLDLEGQNRFALQLVDSNEEFGKHLILNDYETFINKMIYRILAE
ncbi:MAG: hypothetical protein Q4E16_00625 [Neisseria sp.]|nr:hypothetical protein [Neisseria sp.]